MGETRRMTMRLDWRAALLAGTALAMPLPAIADPAPDARPTGGRVTAGAATIARAPTDTRVTQTSNRAVVDWTGFDVGRNQSVTFVQPSAGAVVLNRVDSPNPSQVAGRISANGQVIVENRAGIVFTGSAQVDTAGFVATAAGMSNRAFMAGSTSFDRPARAGARVENQGTITVKEAGLAALVGPSAVNSGTITAKAGRVVIAGAATQTVDLYGDGLISIDTGAAGPAGGVRMTARQADALVTSLVEAGGRIEAGDVRLQATGGSIVIKGAVVAQAGQAGGRIAATAAQVTATAAARVDVSAPAGGGRIALGTAAATRVVDVQPGATLRADATARGDGGGIVLMSSQATRFAGTAWARGGERAGDGGRIEVSSRGVVTLTGVADASAPAGRAGSLVIDPQDLVLAAGGGGNALFQIVGSGGGVAAGSGGLGATTIDPAVFAGLTGNIILQAARDLDVRSPVSVVASTFALQAGRNLTVAAPITMSGGGTIALQSAIAAFAGTPGYDAVGGPGGVLGIAAGVRVASPGGQIALNSNAGGIRVDGTLAAAQVVASVGAGGRFALNGTLQASGTATVSAGQVTVGGLLSAAAAQLAAQGAGTLDIAGIATVAGQLSLAAGGPIRASGSLTAGGLDIAALSAQIGGGNIRVATVTGLDLPAGGTLALAGDTRFTGTLRAGLILPPSPAATATLALSTTGTLTIGQPGTATSLTAGTLALAGAVIDTSAASLLANRLDAVTGGGDMRLGTITIGGPLALTMAPGATLALTAPLRADGTLALVADRILRPLAASLDAGAAGTIAIAPASAGGTLALGTGSLVGLDSASGLTAAALMVGALPPASGAVQPLAGAIVINGFNATGVATLHLASRGDVTQTAPLAGVGRLEGEAGRLLLGNVANLITSLGDIAVAGAVTINGIGGLTALGTVTAGAALAPAAANLAELRLVIDGPILIGQPGTPALLSAGTITLLSPGTISAPNGILRANLLRGPSSGAAFATATGISLRGANLIAELGDMVAQGNIAVADRRDLAVTGTLAAGRISAPAAANNATLDLTVQGGLALSGGLNAGRVNLLASGTIAGAGAVIGTNLLTGPAPGQGIGSAAGVVLTGANRIAALGNIVATGDIRVASLVDLTVSGNLIAGPGGGLAPGNTSLLSLSTPGDLRLGGGGQLGVASAGTVALLAGGTLAEAAGIVATGLLIGAAPGGAFARSAQIDLRGGNFIGRIGDLASAGDILLVNNQALTLGGTITAPGTAAFSVTGDLALGASGAAALINAGTVALVASGRIVENTAGTIVANLLRGPGPSEAFATAVDVLLTGENRIATLGDITASRDLVLTNRRDVAVAGTLAAGGLPALDPANNGRLLLGVDGDLRIDTGGRIGAGHVGLAVTGTIAEAGGVIQAGLLDDPSAGRAAAIQLDGGNRIARLGWLSASGDLLLSNDQALAVTGTVAAGGGAIGAGNTATLRLRVAGDIGVGAPLVGGGVLLLSPGTVAGGGAITANDLLFAPPGGVGTPAAIGLDGANRLVRVGPATVAGDLRLRAASDLVITNPLAAGGTLALSGDAALTLAAALDAPAVTLGAGGALRQMGGTIGATLLGGVAASASLGAANRIVTLGDFATGGDFTLVDAQALRLGGTLAAGGTARLQSAAGIDIGGQGRPARIDAGTLDLQSAGTIAESADSRITAGLLRGPAPGASFAAARAVSLLGDNRLDTLGDLATDGGNLAIRASAPMTVAGTLSASDNVPGGPGNGSGIALGLTSGALTLGRAGAPATLQAIRVDIAAAGGVREVNGRVLTGTLGGQTGLAGVPDSASLDLTNAGNRIITLANIATGAGDLAIANDLLMTVSGTVQVAGTLRLATVGTLTLGGAISAGGAALTSGAGIVQRPGDLDIRSPGATLLIGAPAGGFTQQGGASITSAAPAQISTRDAIVIGGIIDMPGVALGLRSAAGAISETGGSIRAARVDAAAAGPISLAAAGNAIAALGIITTPGSLAVATGTDVALAGDIAAGDASLAAGAITQAGGTLAVGGTLALAADGALALAGRVTAGTLRASATGVIDLDPAGAVNDVTRIELLTGTSVVMASRSALTVTGTVSATGTAPSGGGVILRSDAGLAVAPGSLVSGRAVQLLSSGVVTVQGGIDAASVFIGAPGGREAAGAMFAEGAMLWVGGGLYATSLPLAAWPSFAAGAGGLYVTARDLGFTGQTSIAERAGGAPPVVRIGLSGRGTLSAPVGLSAARATLFLDLGARATIAGQIQVGALAVAYPRGGSGGAELTGSVRGVGGQTAAQVAGAQPGPNAFYRLNACPIASFACVVVTAERLPQTVPVRDLDIRPARDTLDENEVLLPNVARRDL